MQFIIEIKTLIQSARTKAYQAINSAMIEAYWEIGKRIVEEEQNGNQRASYGHEIIKKLSIELTEEFGKGFSERTLREYRQFYNYFPDLEIWRTAFAKLSWSHFQRVLKLSDVKARTYYLNESIENTWSIRTLDRQISTLYFERLISTQQLTGHLMQEVDKVVIDSNDFIKNPTVLEFLNLPSGMSYSEEMFEKALVDNLQKFILELGKGFAFVERQQHIRTETADFYIDLVFYNFKMKCFVLIELKTNKLTHQDIGQLDMYVRMYDDLKRGTDDNPTLGILLCTETDKTIAKYSVLNQNEQLFASKYLPFLPTEAELIEEIEKERLKFKLINQDDNG
jgi:predicted nuclease of restriction endonuclease-like (RecB) superfamily